MLFGIQLQAANTFLEYSGRGHYIIFFKQKKNSQHNTNSLFI